MNQKIKLGLYAALIVGAIVFGALFYSSYRKASEPRDFPNVSPSEHTAKHSTNVSDGESPETTPATNAIAATQTNNAISNAPASNELASATNTATQPDTNAVASNTVREPVVQTYGSIGNSNQPGQDRSAMIGYFVAFLGTSILLGLLVAHDVSHYFGGRSVDFLFNDKGVGVKDPEYEEAEQVWANGQHLDAVRMMRDYLTKNPREQHVALRIAEIYEKDLKNYLAAALEYEEVLKHKLPPQRWGWAAIHLCNLYFKLHKTDQAVPLLHRIVNEYGETPAAEKARKRLAMFESVGEEGLDGDLPENIELPPKPVKKEESSASASNSNLPPGFRPKK